MKKTIIRDAAGVTVFEVEDKETLTPLQIAGYFALGLIAGLAFLFTAVITVLRMLST